jgi:uncharacterized damage-inducible protein DinB
MPAIVRPVGDERDALLTFLAQQRSVVRLAAHGLTDEQAALTPTVSDLSVGGLLVHLTSVERSWTAAIVGGPGAASPDRQFDMPAGTTLADVLSAYERATEETDDAVAAAATLDQPVPVPAGARWAPPDVEGWSVRWVLLHLIQETARHAGHADIIRESIDGATALPLMAAVERWAPRRTIQPWTPGTTEPG